MLTVNCDKVGTVEVKDAWMYLKDDQGMKEVFIEEAPTPEILELVQSIRESAQKIKELMSQSVA